MRLPDQDRRRRRKSTPRSNGLENMGRARARPGSTRSSGRQSGL